MVSFMLWPLYLFPSTHQIEDWVDFSQSGFSICEKIHVPAENPNVVAVTEAESTANHIIAELHQPAICY